MKKGFFISFEGTEGCGKSTHAALLHSYLKSLGKKSVLTLEPGSTKIGKEVRKLLLSTEEPLAKNAELFLFACDRSQHVEQVIAPALNDGAVVICDRFTDSTLAYQIGGRKLPEELVRYVNAVSSCGLIPDLTFLLDVSPMVGLPRAIGVSSLGKGKVKKIDRFEKEKIAFHDEVRAFYLETAKNDPGRFRIIDTEKQSQDASQDQIKGFVRQALGL